MTSEITNYLLYPQNELVEKFNAAFYEAQQQKLPLNDDDELLETFDESYFTNIDAYENDFDYTELSESLDEVFGVNVNEEEEEEQFSSFYVPPPFVEKLPPISSIQRSNNTDFANFLRNMPCDSLDLFAEVSTYREEKKTTNNFSTSNFFRVIFKVITDTFSKMKQQPIQILVYFHFRHNSQIIIMLL